MGWLPQRGGLPSLNSTGAAAALPPHVTRYTTWHETRDRMWHKTWRDTRHDMTHDRMWHTTRCDTRHDETHDMTWYVTECDIRHDVTYDTTWHTTRCDTRHDLTHLTCQVLYTSWWTHSDDTAASDNCVPHQALILSCITELMKKTLQCWTADHCRYA